MISLISFYILLHPFLHFNDMQNLKVSVFDENSGIMKF